MAAGPQLQLAIRHLFNVEQPFGPIKTEDIDEPDLLQLIFDRENKIYREMSRNPSVILGRRGAGKTAFLKSAYHDGSYDVVVELLAHEAFREIVTTVDKICPHTAYAEEVAEVWDVLFWNSVMVRLVQLRLDDTPEMDLVRQYIKGMELKENESGPYAVMRRVIERLLQFPTDSTIGASVRTVAGLVHQVIFGSIPFVEARKAAAAFLEEKAISAIVLLDSLEDFQLENESNGRAISGLLTYQGLSRSARDNFRIRFCLPTELWHKLLELSKNPIKDFRSRLLLHWHPREILEIAAHRYVVYLDTLDSERAANLRKTLDARGGVRGFWAKLLPDSITNGLRLPERSIPYILRHTQLLPRQLLLYLNHISREHHAQHGSATPFSAEAIRNGIRQAEGIICEEILSAYSFVHPGGRTACERCIPELPLRFSDATLRQTYGRFGHRRIPGVTDYTDFKRLMIEIGAIGKVTKETDIYLEGQFEYTAPHRLIVSTNDELCLHPVFSVTYAARRSQESDKRRVVYPSGSDLSEADYRGNLD